MVYFTVQFTLCNTCYALLYNLFLTINFSFYNTGLQYSLYSTKRFIFFDVYKTGYVYSTVYASQCRLYFTVEFMIYHKGYALWCSLNFTIHVTIY